MKKARLFVFMGLFSLLFSSCSIGGSSSTTPTYQGMTIAHAVKSSSNKNILFAENNEHEEQDDKLEEDISDIVTIDIQTDDEIKYYVKPNETFIIEVHISNPKDYEIQSFTLNGKKYANYMFKEGSTMELLLLETTAPSISGYIDYTIDAIKYIDGTDIKDVDMSKGNKSIKAGVAYSTAPSARITASNVGTTSIELSVEVNDPHSLIGDNELAFYLSDGKDIIASKQLVVGNNTVRFNNLTMAKTYQYGVVAVYDFVDGKDLHPDWILKNEIKTLSAFIIKDVVPSKDSISFEIEKTGETGDISAISLYDSTTNELKEKGNAETRSFKGLLSDHTYNLYVDFTYQINNETKEDWVSVKGIQTIANKAPTVVISEEIMTDTTISAVLSFNDDDAVGMIDAVEIYKGNDLVAVNSSKQIDFSNLEYYTNYQVVVTYSYDLNNGAGVKTEKVTKNYQTSPHVAITNCKIINTSPVNEGETIYLQLSLENSHNAVPSSVVVNEKTYQCTSSSTTSKAFVEIINNGQFEGGLTTLVIQSLNVKLDNKNYSILPQINNSADVRINGRLYVKGISFAIDGVDVDAAAYTEKVDLHIKLLNKTDYNLDTATIYGKEFNTFTKIDADNYLIEDFFSYFGSSSGAVKAELTGVSYSNEYVKNTLAYDTISASIYLVSNSEPLSIANVSDFSNLKSGYQYKLVDDIDFSGVEWANNSFDGVIDGGNHSISGLNYVGTKTNAHLNYGLFNDFYGLIKNLTFIDCTVLATVKSESNETYTANCGVVCSQCNYGIIKDCSFKDIIMSVNNELGLSSVSIVSAFNTGAITNCEIENCKINVEGKENFAGGITVENGGYITKCNVEIDIKNTGHFDNGGMTYYGMCGVGGIATSNNYQGYILRNKVYCTLSASGVQYLGGVVGSNVGYITYNYVKPIKAFEYTTGWFNSVSVGGIYASCWGEGLVSLNYFDSTDKADGGTYRNTDAKNNYNQKDMSYEQYLKNIYKDE